jgi:hypothetical protein
MERTEIENDSAPDQAARITRPLASGLSVLAGVLRLLPLPPNFAPVGALGLFGGARLRSWQAFVVPMAVMLASDVLLAKLRGREYLFHPVTLFVYASFLIYVVIGRALRRTESPWWIAAASFLGSIQFFLVTNFGQWLVMGIAPGTKSILEPGQYYLTFAGLIECYAQALPFYRTTLLSDLLFTAVFFGLHALLTRTYFVAERVPVRKDRE